MNLSSIIEKVAKLRALSQSDNVNEAATAAALAEKLIQEHRLSEAELESASSAPHEAPDEDQDPLFVYSTLPRWKSNLSVRLCRFYGVACYLDPVHKDQELSYGGSVRVATGEQAFKMIGRRSDVEIARYQFAFLILEIERLTQAFHRATRRYPGYNGRTALNSFRIGAVVGVTEAMAEAAKKTTAVPTSGAMVLASRFDEANEAMAKLHPRLRKQSSRGSRIDGSAYGAGQAAGRSIRQHAAIGGGGGRALKA